MVRAQGDRLLGRARQPGSKRGRAQFMFQRTTGERVTLYIGSLGPPAGASRSDETAFRYSTDGPVPTFYWVDRRFGSALTGPLSHDALLGVATVVYRQLEKSGG